MLLIKNFFNLVFGNFGISQSSAKSLLIRLPGLTEISLIGSYQDILTYNGTTYVIFWKKKRYPWAIPSSFSNWRKSWESPSYLSLPNPGI